MKRIWPFTFYFLYFAALSSIMPFFVLFYQGLEFTGAQIGLHAFEQLDDPAVHVQAALAQGGLGDVER